MEQMISRFDGKRLIESREMRVFLSSTFVDMTEERNALIKTFNSLKIEANRRNVALSVIDLRWGVTEDDLRSGRMLSVCLEEIEHSHPFFIGLLGNRYGTSPNVCELEKNPELEERYPWIRKDIEDGLSVTEMEIQYGILRNKYDVDAAFFFKKSPDTVSDDNEKLKQLKRKILERHNLIKAEYTSIDDLCAKLESAVKKILNKHFPVGELSLLERERTAQKAYINTRHGYYQRMQADFDCLDAFMRGDKTHLVITGPSGMGKSALIANWLKQIVKERETLPYNIIYHFVGNSYSGSDYRQILQHICYEIYDLYGLERHKDVNEPLVKEAQRILIEAGKKGKPLFIVIDGINQIIDNDNSKLLNWLPQAPQTTKYLFSTIENDETMATFKRDGYPIYGIRTPDKITRQQFIIHYLSNVGKKLTQTQINRILDDPENENMLVLKTLLDELICFGSHEHLDNRINFYISATSIENFFDRMLLRMEKDYLEVPCILSLIALSENGMKEEELQAISRLRPIDFHQFFSAFYNHLVIRNGLITFVHQYVSNAVRKRYNLDNTEKARPYRQQIIDHIISNNNVDRKRRTKELAFQYDLINNDDKLFNTILSFDAFDIFNDTEQNKALLARYWNKLMKSSTGKYNLRAYLDSSSEDRNIADFLIRMGDFVMEYMADPKTAMLYYQKFQSTVNDGFWDENQYGLGAYYNRIGLCYNDLGDYEESRRSYFKALKIYEQLDLRLDQNRMYNNIGEIYRQQGLFKEALFYYDKALASTQDGGDLEDFEIKNIAGIYNNMGLVFYELGEYKRALESYKKSLISYDKSMNQDKLFIASVHNNIGLVYDMLYEHSKSLEYYMRSLGIMKMILGEDHPKLATLYNNIARSYFKQGLYSEAIKFHEKDLLICEKILGKEHPSIISTYNNMGQILTCMGEITKAIEFLDKSLSLSLKIHGRNNSETATCYNALGDLYREIHYYAEALKYYRNAVDVYATVLGEDHVYTATTRYNIGYIYCVMGNYVDSYDYLCKSFDAFSKQMGHNHHDTLIVYRLLSEVKARLYHA